MIQQASAVPYRRRNDRIEFCLITATGKGRWIFPKGIIDPGETFIQTALKEAREEAGIEGEVIGEPLGSYEYAKWDTTLRVVVVLMRVTQEASDWPEAELRRRQWAGFEPALEMLTRPELRDLLRVAHGRLTGEASSAGGDG